MPSLGDYLLIFVVAVLTTYLGTAFMRRIAPRIGAIVLPDERRVHERPTATLGGAAMVLGFLVAFGVAWLSGLFAPMFAAQTEAIGIVLAVLVIFAVGAIDDLREISAPAKTAGMVLAGSILSVAGVSIVVFRVPFFGLSFLSPDLSALVTVVWVVGMMNAINLIDGLDGLAAGITAIAAGTFFLYSVRLGELDVILPGNPAALIAVIVAGLCVGFLPHNFHPARIFMGDAGALVLGLLMAVSTITVGGRTSQAFSGQAYFFFAPIFIPLVILGVPILDTALAIVRRATQRKGIASADKNHLHHRLMRLGHGQRRSVLILWLWTALLSGFVLYPTYNEGRGDALVPTGIAALGLVLYTILHPGLRPPRPGDEAAGDPATEALGGTDAAAAGPAPPGAAGLARPPGGNSPAPRVRNEPATGRQNLPGP
jgi:UDP-GlcNAc:undecaprenyl-phosphate/decaprenyl-phosphate GlcNAc-1-phosphate transferase